MQLIEDIKIILPSVFRIDPATVYPVKGGWSARAYFIESRSGDRFLMKVYEKARKSTAKLTANVEYYMPIVDWLYSNTRLYNKIVDPIKTMKGKYKYENANYAFLLFRYIDGDNITEKTFLGEQVIQLADILSILHSYGDNLPLETEYIREAFDIEFCSSLQKIMQEKDFLKVELHVLISRYSNILGNAIDKLKRLSAELKKSQLEYVLCHTDVHEGNILETKDGIALIDWENLKLAPAEADFFSLVEKPWFEQFLDRYKKTHAGYEINSLSMQFYQLRRKLEDIWEFVEQLQFDTINGDDRRLISDYLRQELESILE